MPTLRTSEGDKKYHEYLLAHASDEKCGLCEKPALQSFTYWKIVENSFPYDTIADTHHMVVPIEHKTEDLITQEEWSEYQTIKRGFIDKNYDHLIESTTKRKTIPNHFHIHLITRKS